MGYAHRRTGTGQPTRTGTYRYGASSTGFNVIPAVEAWNVIKRIPREERTDHVRTPEGWRKVRILSPRGFKLVREYIERREAMTERQRKYLRETYFNSFFAKKMNDIFFRNSINLRIVPRGRR